MFLSNYYKCLAMLMRDETGASGVTIKSTNGTSCNLYTKAGTSVISYPLQVGYIMGMFSTSNSSMGIILGDGTTAPTLSDYKLSGNMLTSATATVGDSVTIDDNGITRTAVLTVNNTGTTDFVVSEVGLIGRYNYGSSYADFFLWERSLLDKPVTIPAGGAGQITYSIRFNFPTA